MVVGNLALALALPVSIYSIFTSIGVRPAIRQRRIADLTPVPMWRRATHLVTALLTIASSMLVMSFVNDSFGIEYVYSYSSRSLSLIYKICGLWAGLDGSLLFWVWLMAVCASIVACIHPKNQDEVKDFSIIGAVLQVIVTFFLIMLIFEANPFTQILPTPTDGRGLNPLLQNFFMIIHPPALYIGYVGFAVPFAYAIALLVRGDRDGQRAGWFRDVRLWTIVSWLFLTLGNLLGAMWAYVELGWGGFWAWDPVENAGIMPWFTATAFLHSVMIEERRGMLRLWNLVLLILTFLLTIFGTFITRSGVIRSVHSFSDITIGTYFIVFLALSTLFSAALVFLRRKTLRGHGSLESLISREGAFYGNIALFVLSLFAITWGTCLPLFVEGFTGRKIEVEPSFFNRVMAPLGIAILILTGIGPEMSWRRLGKGLLRREFLLPTLIAFVAAVAAFVLGVNKWFPVMVAFGAAFVVATLVSEFWRSSRIIAGRNGRGVVRALLSLFRMAPRRYGGLIVHLGVAIFFVGLAGSSYQAEYHLTLERGVKKQVAGFELLLDSLEEVPGRDKRGIIADVEISEGARSIGHLRPALFLHRNQPKPIAEVDLKIGLLKDIYLAMGAISESGNGAELTLTINPLIGFVWFGGLVVSIGTVLAILPPRRRGGKRSDDDEETQLDIALDRALKEDFA